MNEERYLSEIEELKKRVCSLELENSRGRFVNFFSRSFTRLNMIFGIGITVLATSLVLYAAQRFFTEGDLIVAEDVNSNFSELYSSVGSYGDDIAALESAVESIDEDISTLQFDVAGNTGSILDLLPIGTIVAWHKSFTGTPDLPAGWEECSGQTLWDDESPYDGQPLPDLNNQRYSWNSRGLFLRGHTVSGIYENDAFQGHGHNIARTGDTNFQFHVDGDSPYNEDVESDGSDDDTEYTLSSLANDLSATYPQTYGSYGSPRYSYETRSVNMSVVWIIKVK